MSNSSIISYNLELLDEYSNNMQFVATTLADIQSTINNFSNNIDSFWIGGAKDTFITNKDKSIQDIESLSEQIKSNSEKLSQTIVLYKEKNEIVSETVDLLSTADIF